MFEKFHRGDIYSADLSPGIGSEQSGSRPVLILQNNVGNCFSPTIIIAAITSVSKKNRKFPTHYHLNDRCGLVKPSVVMLEAIDNIIPFLKGDADMIGLVCNTIRKLFCMSDEGYEIFLMDLEDYKAELEEEDEDEE